MLLVIHNLPQNMRFFDVKSLIQDECGFDEVILDNLTDEGDTKRVTVGLADEGDAAILVRKINGLYLGGRKLFVEDVRQKKSCEQPYRPMDNPHVPKPRPEKQMKYSQPIPVRPEIKMKYSQSISVRPDKQIKYSQSMPARPEIQMTFSQSMQVRPENEMNFNQPLPVRPENQIKYDQPMPVMPEKQMKYDHAMPVRPGYQTDKEQSMPAIMPMVYSNLPFYMSPVQSSYKGYENQGSQMAKKPLPQPAYYQAQHEQPGAVNEWNVQPAYSSYPEQSRRLPDDEGDEPKWRERQGARSSLMLDDESRWVENRYQSDSSRYEQGYRRSLERDDEISGNRLTQFDKSRQDESDGRDRRDHSQGRRDDGRRSSKRNDDHMRPRPIDRSPPRDRNFESRRRSNFDERGRDSDHTDSRRAIDHRERDRDQRHGSDRYEKPRERDRYNEPRDGNKPRRDHDYGQRDFGKKRPYSDVSQTSSRTYGNNPDNSTFSKSNTKIFERNYEDPTTGAYATYKRLRFSQNDYAGPADANLKQNDAPKSGNKPGPPLLQMVKRHNNWRYQIAAILAKEIISTAHPGRVPNYPVIYKKLKECVVARIDVHLGDTIVSSLKEMLYGYRSRFPPDDDVGFYKAVLEKIERDQEESATDTAKDKTPDDRNNEMTKKPNQRAENAAKGGLLPPPFKLPGAGNNPQPTVPSFQNRASSAPSFQTRPTSTPPFQNRTPNPTSQVQNRHQNPTMPFANNPPNPNPYFKNLGTTTAPQFQKRAPVLTPQFRSRAPTPAPNFQNRAPISTPQFQKSAPTSTPQVMNAGLLSFPVLQQCRAPIPTIRPPKPPQKKPSQSNNLANSEVNAKNPLTKKEINKIKMLHKMEFKDEVVYNVDPWVKQAIENEMDSLIELYTARPESFMKQTEHNIHKRIVNETAPIFRKVLTLNVTKRILNIMTGLVLRVFPIGKWPKHASFDRYMKQKGVVNIKKCPKMYVVTCGSYKSYDDLVEMETFKLEDCHMMVKTMHVAGPRPSMREKLRERNFKRQNMQVAGSEAMMFDEDDFALDDCDGDNYTGTYNANIDNIDKEEDKNQTDQDDVVYVDSEKEVVLIDDDEEQEAEGKANNDTNAGKAGGSGKKNSKESTQPKDDVEIIESLEKESQETAENVDSLVHESKDIDQKVICLDENEEPEGNVKTLEQESNPSAQNEETQGNVATLAQESEPTDQDIVCLDENETEGNVKSLAQESKPTDPNIISLDENEDTVEYVETLKQECESSEQNVVSLDENKETERKFDSLEQESKPTNQNVISKHENETDENVSEDIIESEIIDHIADDDLEDF
ncbi:uncharacterized protein LOC120634784 isoform X2 [Pararge aegeria]|uniref:uncharacterized protein LOC120634784 isoform X2 n=1 Tax=Pararge aegeria TaxID=116150 RepID=UPI0019D0D3E7|nr:uncharacterized protein LOC120634784 isoform X2 [Pararge aegeria]